MRFLLLISLLLLAAPLCAETKVVAYVPNWIDLKAFAPQIDYAKLTHINVVGDTIWHKSIPTTRAKAAMVREQELGGLMIWSLDSDAPGENSLLTALHEVLQQRK